MLISDSFRRLCQLALALMACALASPASALVPRNDQVRLPASGSVYLDLLANDENASGRELAVTVNTNGLTGILVHHNGDGGVVIEIDRTDPNNVQLNGDKTFSYKVNDGGAPKTKSVRVCWGNVTCVPLKALAAEDRTDDGSEDPGQPADACTDLCFMIGGVRYRSGELHDFGAAPAGTQVTVPVTIENGTADPIVLEAVLLGVATTARWEEGTPIRRTIAAGGSAVANLRVIHLPPPSGQASNWNAIYAAETGGTGRSWGVAFTSTGDGNVTVPGYEDCAFHDTCLYVAGVKRASALGGSSGYTHAFGAVNVGDTRSVDAVLVYNEIPGDGGPQPWQFIAHPELRLIANGVAVSGGVLVQRQPVALRVDLTPSSAGSSSRPVDFVVGLGGQHVSFNVSATASYVGSDCQRCELYVNGVRYANGSTIDFGSQASGNDSVFTGVLRNTAQVPALAGIITSGDAAQWFGFEGFPDRFTIPAGGEIPFTVRVRYRPGLQLATLKLREPFIGATIYASWTLRSTGIGELPIPPQFAQCTAARYSLCLYVNGVLADALPKVGQPMLNPPGVSFAHDFGPFVTGQRNSVPVAIINNEGGGLGIAVLAADGGAKLFRNGVELPPGSQLTVGTFPNHIVELSAEQTFYNTAGLGNLDPVLSRILLRFGMVPFDRPIFLVSNCPAGVGGCVFGDLANIDWTRKGQRGYVSTANMLQQVGFALYNRNLGPSLSLQLANASVPDRIRFAFWDSGQTDQFLSLNVPKGRMYTNGLDLSFLPSGSNRADLFVRDVTANTPAQWLRAVRTTTQSPADQFEACTGVCLYTRLDREADFVDDALAADFLGALGQPARLAHATAQDLNQTSSTTPWLLANDTASVKHLRLRITQATSTFSLGTAVSGNSPVFEEERWLPPRSAVPVRLNATGQFNLSTAQLDIVDDAGVHLYVDLVNTPPRPYSDCLDTCLEVNGQRVPSGSAVALRGTAGVASAATVKVINGAAQSRPWQFALTTADGFPSVDPSVVLGGTCAAAGGAHTCSGTLAAGTAAQFTVSFTLDAATGYRVVGTRTAVGTGQHAAELRLTTCADVCLYERGSFLANGSPLALGPVPLGAPSERALLVINTRTSAVTLSLTGAAAFTLTGTTTVAASSAANATLRVVPVSGPNAATLAIRTSAGVAVSSYPVSAQGVRFVPVRVGRIWNLVPGGVP